MSDEKLKKLEELRLDTKIEGLARTLEALRADHWSDVAKLGKDAYVAVLKEENLIHQRRCLDLGFLRSLGDRDQIRRYVENQQIDVAKALLPPKTEEPKEQNNGKDGRKD